MTDSEKVRPVAARWRPSALLWGLAHPEVHGLGTALENRIAAPTDDERSQDDLDELATRIEDARETYIINASQDQIWYAIQEVNEWIADRPHGTEMDADDFQKALAFPPRRSDGGDHDDDEPDER